MYSTRDHQAYFSYPFYWLFNIFLMNLFIVHANTPAHAFNVGSIEVQVIDANHTQLPTYHHQGQHYIMGRYNQRYMLRVTNHSNQRFELVMTVDGRDIVNGQLGSYSHRGYVIDPHQSFNVEGFRRSEHQVAAFRFTTPSDSYASRMNSGQNIGVIGVALFSEKKRRPVYYPTHRNDLSAPNAGSIDLSPTSSSSSASLRSRSRSTSKRSERISQSEIGTRYGEELHSETEHTIFERASTKPQHILVVHYDSESGLRKRGVLHDRRHTPTPHAFPSEPIFAPPPPGYR